MQTYADLCRLMQTHADLCRSMQTYADLGSPMFSHAAYANMQICQNHYFLCKSIIFYANLLFLILTYAEMTLSESGEGGLRNWGRVAVSGLQT